MFDDSRIGQLDGPIDAEFDAEVERSLREALGDAEYERIMTEPDDDEED